MKAIDMQVCTSTREGIGRMIRDDGILAELTQYFRSPDDYFKTEESSSRDLEKARLNALYVVGHGSLWAGQILKRLRRETTT